MRAKNSDIVFAEKALDKAQSSGSYQRQLMQLSGLDEESFRLALERLRKRDLRRVHVDSYRRENNKGALWTLGGKPINRSAI